MKVRRRREDVFEEVEERVSTQVLLEEARKAKARHLLLCRSDPDEFCQYVGRNSLTGERIVQQQIHVEFQRLATEVPRLILMAHPDSGKSTQLTILRVLWELGRNPNLRIAIASKTQDNAAKFLKTARDYIEKSEELHAVFPSLVKGSTWTDYRIEVYRTVYSRDPSIQAVGLESTLVGSRIDILVLDDILDDENTGSPAERLKVLMRLRRAFFDRLSEKARVWFLTNAWHPDDAAHKLARGEEGQESRWELHRFPIYDEATGRPSWPDHWSEDRIEEKRGDTTPLEFARAFLCKARDDAAARFQKEWIDNCLSRGEGKSYPRELEYVPRGWSIYTGVDLAVSRKVGADYTVMFTIAVSPEEDREILEVLRKRMTGPEIVETVIDVHHRYHSIIYVENNAAQDYILQFVPRGSACPVKAFTTGKNKWSEAFGVESLAVELHNQKWVIPCERGTRKVPTGVSCWISDMLYYDPRAHTGDTLMAAWIAREAARAGATPKRKVRTGHLDLVSR